MDAKTDTRRPGPYHPQGVLQWHITERCNLRCAHCYQEDQPADELPLDDLLTIVDQFKALLARWRRDAIGLPVRGQITVTGGEPFIRSDFMALLAALAAAGDDLSFTVLSNGTFIDKAMAHRLAELGAAFVQISIDGCRETHDKIRGAGAYDKAVSALQALVGEGVPTLISFTAHADNYREFADVARLGCELRVSRVWTDRLVEHGRGSTSGARTLTPGQTRELFDIMLGARIDAACSVMGQTEIAMARALQFLVSGERPYRCRAGDSLITVMPNGDVYPCRRMPIRVGNLMETPLVDLYYSSEVFAALRDRDRVSDGCETCRYGGACRGGAKCIAHAMTGSSFVADPGCWLADRRSSSPQ